MVVKVGLVFCKNIIIYFKLEGMIVFKCTRMIRMQKPPSGIVKRILNVFLFLIVLIVDCLLCCIGLLVDINPTTIFRIAAVSFSKLK